MPNVFWYSPELDTGYVLSYDSGDYTDFSNNRRRGNFESCWLLNAGTSGLMFDGETK